mmetsp:Transcript_67435/g.119205  ORF Transcript_67435/g.119205 Transcript_67435/m.119205 type:complete len:109 (+) Transcript_67435:177-503(+)
MLPATLMVQPLTLQGISDMRMSRAFLRSTAQLVLSPRSRHSRVTEIFWMIVVQSLLRGQLCKHATLQSELISNFVVSDQKSFAVLMGGAVQTCRRGLSDLIPRLPINP